MLGHQQLENLKYKRCFGDQLAERSAIFVDYFTVTLIERERKC